MNINYCIDFTIPINWVVVVWLSIGLLYTVWSVIDHGYFSLRLLPICLAGVLMGPITIAFGYFRSYQVAKFRSLIYRTFKKIVDREYRLRRFWFVALVTSSFVLFSFFMVDGSPHGGAAVFSPYGKLQQKHIVDSETCYYLAEFLPINSKKSIFVWFEMNCTASVGDLVELESSERLRFLEESLEDCGDYY